jgi:hypothetical protein
MTTWSKLRDRTLRTLNDTDRDKASWTDDDMLDYINAALGAVSVHTAQEKVHEQTVAQTTTVLVLPVDCIGVKSVLLGTSTSLTLLKRAALMPGETVSLTTNSLPKNWAEPVAGQVMFFPGPVPAQALLKVGYLSNWPTIVNDDDDLPVPYWLLEALHFYMLYLSQIKPGTQAASLGQYKTKVDSGQPENNPLKAFAEYCFQQYQRVLNEHAPNNALYSIQ